MPYLPFSLQSPLKITIKGFKKKKKYFHEDKAKGKGKLLQPNFGCGETDEQWQTT